ncbi:MAG: hypothetical protein RJA81_592, partial [Planctomycetota bacterium]
GGNLIHRKTLARSGTHYLAKRADDGVEFITSTDNWFRPVNFANTPHGTIMILDMYRETIEHPFSIPEPIKMHLDLTSGKNRGRLYHLVHKNFSPRKIVNLHELSSVELVPYLNDSDSWWRETAQRLLIERQELSAVKALENLALTSESDLGRAHALWTLQALGALKPEILAPAFDHPNAGLREQAARLAEPFLNKDPALAEKLVGLSDDQDGFVLLQTAFSLGELQSDNSTDALVRLAGRDNVDSWIKAAILSSVHGRELKFIQRVAASKAKDSAKKAWMEEIAAMIASRSQEAEVSALIEVAFSGSNLSILADPALNGLALGSSRSKTNLEKLIPPAQRKLMDARIQQALLTIRDKKQNDTARIAAIRVARLGSSETLTNACQTMLNAGNSPGVQLASIQTLSSLSPSNLAEILLSQWSEFGPSQRREVIESMMVRPDRQLALLKEIQSGNVPATELDPSRRTSLLESKSDQISKIAKVVFANLPSVSRQEVVSQFASAAKISGDAKAGEAVYRKVCATCHKAGRLDAGVDVGPNLQTVISRSPEDLLGHILEPNKEIAPQYLNYTVALKDGRIVTGMIVSESSNSIVLKRAEGVTETVPRQDIEEARSTGQSLMPEGLEQGLKSQDFADLIQFIKQIGNN